MMNRIATLLLCLISVSCLAMTVEVTVVDEFGDPVVGAEVSVPISHTRVGPDNNIVPRNYAIGLTNEKGMFNAEAEGPMSIGIWAKKDGYYSYGYRPAKPDSRFYEAPIVRKTAVLRSIGSPAPLYARRSELFSNSQREIPEMNVWIGFDFEQGDWVQPHGEGKITDIQFRYNSEFVKFVDTGWTVEKLREVNRRKIERQGRNWNEEVFRKEAGLWEGTLEIASPGTKEGLVKVDEGFMLHSGLRMPHQAPEEVYAPTHLYHEADGEPNTFRDDVGFFLRTRVVLDQQGNIESANYTKIYGDFQFSPKGFIAFDYYFNPTPNDRNLEFDPKQNLFPESVEGSKVILP